MKSFHLSVITLQSDKSFRHKHPVLVRPCLHFKYLLKPMKLSIAWENFIRPSLSPSTEVLIKLLHKTWCHLSMSHIKRHQMNATIASFRKWFAKMTWTLQSRCWLSKEKIAKERIRIVLRNEKTTLSTVPLIQTLLRSLECVLSE